MYRVEKRGFAERVSGGIGGSIAVVVVWCYVGLKVGGYSHHRGWGNWTGDEQGLITTYVELGNMIDKIR